ncbi:MAG: NAD(P)H-hydrate dehydratase [Sphaerochaetaceae bacterium]|jgi:hydroxyethylthiazole kinase-like uncharacterized protein yjeF
MEKLVLCEVTTLIDQKSQQEYRIPAVLLMEHAGIKGWNLFYQEHEELDYSDILVIAGGGNNGGDALVMAKEIFLQQKHNITVLFVGTKKSQLCQIQYDICRTLEIPLYDALNQEGALKPIVQQLIEKSTLIIDGIAGTGLKGPLREDVASLVRLINESSAFTLSIDAPSGYSDTLTPRHPHVHSDVTVTMGLKKVGAFHPAYRPSWGKIVQVNPSFPPALLKKAEARAHLVHLEDLYIPPISETTHKYERGHVALFAGSKRYSGAARLASEGAFSSRCGLVSLYCDSDVASQSASTIVYPLQGGVVIPSESLAHSYDAIVVGPGWGEGRMAQLIEIVRSKLPVVIDADGLVAYTQALSEKRLSKKEGGPIVLTPHPGELRKMLDALHLGSVAQEISSSGSIESFIEAMEKAASLLGVILLFKSSVIWIFDGITQKKPLVIEGLNNALGVAGSGDVLSGILGSLLAQQFETLSAVTMGVLLHQKAGQLARKELGWFDSEMLTRYVGLATRLAEVKEK